MSVINPLTGRKLKKSSSVYKLLTNNTVFRDDSDVLVPIIEEGYFYNEMKGVWLHKKFLNTPKSKPGVKSAKYDDKPKSKLKVKPVEYDDNLKKLLILPYFYKSFVSFLRKRNNVIKDYYKLIEEFQAGKNMNIKKYKSVLDRAHSLSYEMQIIKESTYLKADNTLYALAHKLMNILEESRDLPLSKLEEHIPPHILEYRWAPRVKSFKILSIGGDNNKGIYEQDYANLKQYLK